ncbi:MAG: hypothetical protein ACK4N5_12745, partial [Myxococcales bacterium]
MPNDTPLTAEALAACAAVLERLAEDRAHLAAAEDDVRERLLRAAGRVASPTSKDKRKLLKELRKQERRELKAQDRKVISETGLRVQRQAAVLDARPTPLLPGAL